MTDGVVSIPLKPLGKTLELLQLRSTLSHGTTIWPSALLLSQWMLQVKAASVGEKRVLELGAGCGLVGLTACALGASNVCMTDLNTVVQSVLRPNAHRNGLNLGVGALTALSTAALDWTRWKQDEAMQQVLENEWDWVMAADCIYERSLLPDFISCLVQASISTKGDEADNENTLYYSCKVIVASERRDDIVRAEFLRQVAETGFQVTPVSKRIVRKLASEYNARCMDVGGALDQVEIWMLRLSKNAAIKLQVESK